MTEEKCKINGFLYSISNREKFNAFKQGNVKIKAVICGEQKELEKGFGTHGNVKRLKKNSNNFSSD